MIPNKNKPEPPRSQCIKLLDFYQSGRYLEAEKLAININKKFKNHNFSLKVLGAVFRKTGRLSEALVVSEKAVGIDPQDYETHFNLANSLKALGRIEEAEKSYTQAIKLKVNF